jgi:hypothetical protein
MMNIDDSQIYKEMKFLFLDFYYKVCITIAYERDMIKGIYMSYVCKISFKIPRIKNI